MKRGLAIFGVIVLVLLAGVGGAYWWISRPVEIQPFEEPGPSIEAKQQNSLVQTMLLSEGIEASLVDIDSARAYVAYDAPTPPAGEALDVEELQEGILHSLADAAPGSSRAVIVMFVDGALSLVWKADLDALRALPEDEDGTALEAYLETIEKTSV